MGQKGPLLEDTIRTEFAMTPIFIVGSGRSGTSILLNTVRKTLDLPSHGEGHFFPMMLALNTATNQYFDRRKFQAKSPNHMLHNVDIKAFRRLLAEPVRKVFVDMYGEDGFVDKTPGRDGIVAIPHMQTVFPGMRVIYAQRRGLEVVRSAVRKFPHADFKTHCEIWRDCMVAWKASSARLRCDYIELDQFDLHTKPEAVTNQLAAFLELDDEQREKMLGFFQNDRPQSSGNLNEVVRAIGDLGWTDEQIDTFREICGEVMQECGYSETESYFAESEHADG